ncbi:sporulation protein [Paenibacillus sambharensis]|uniref:Sporulation protein n=1 Tax=Paenibacillus sambharensis TaxID=1803190 RepID=A0A2W1LH24_9BACL|nr:putative sporulation protein YtxC [Paenibacillus sambharensis]PZD94325.1 sporulation protein [Paenibacillus sambharensis]
MELFAVTLGAVSEEKLSCLTRCLSDAFADLHRETADIGYWEVDADHGRLAYISRTPAAATDTNRKLVHSLAASGMAAYIMTETEPLLLRTIARKQFRYEHDEDLDRIIWHCRQQLDGPEADSDEEAGMLWDPEAKARRKSLIAGELEQFLANQHRVHLEGFITFRLSSYWQELREVVEYAVDEFVMDKQYQEFISLLRYFVCLQEPKLELLHVIHRNDNDFAFYDAQYEPIEHRQVDRIVADMLEAEMNVEDMVVSNLISISPQEIIIHTREPEQQVIRTIESIFDSRVTICTSCRTCRPAFDGHVQPRDQRLT